MVPVSHLCRVRVAKQDIELGIGRGHHTNARSEVTKHVVGHFLQDVGIQVLYAGGGEEDKGGWLCRIQIQIDSFIFTKSKVEVSYSSDSFLIEQNKVPSF